VINVIQKTIIVFRNKKTLKLRLFPALYNIGSHLPFLNKKAMLSQGNRAMPL